MDFIFKDPAELNLEALAQGDLIARTAEVTDRLRQAHQYYADAPNYTHFVVLTQSCDLVKRRGDFRAPYITVAAAKPFNNLVVDFFEENLRKIDNTDFSYQTESLIGKAKQLLERHLNNTEPDFFFLPKAGHPGLVEDLVVFLRLSIALRKEHYDALASAKIAELADVFQAKLGWLTGNIYSRVATPDIEERNIDAADVKKKFYESYIPTETMVRLTALQAGLLRKLVNERHKELGRTLTTEEVLEIIDNQIPKDVQIVAKNIVDRLIKRNLLDPQNESQVQDFARTIAAESSFKALVKSAEA